MLAKEMGFYGGQHFLFHLKAGSGPEATKTQNMRA